MPPAPPVVVAPPAPTPPPKPVVTPPVVIPPVATVQKQVKARVQEVRCARIDSAIKAKQIVQLRGFAGSASDLAKLESDLLTMPGVRRVDSKVTLYPWPQCEVFLNFADTLKTPRGLKAKVRGASAQAFAQEMLVASMSAWAPLSVPRSNVWPPNAKAVDRLRKGS